jgi:alcohol dehydrogenase
MPVLPDWVSYHFPPKIHIEIDCGNKCGNFIKNIGSRIVIITTQKELTNKNELLSIKKSIEKNTDGVVIYDDIEVTPSLKDLDSAAHFARQAQVNCIVAYGSYESVNAAKLISILATNDVFADELINNTKQIKKPPIPVVIIPTMPLMGMECSPFSFIIDDNDGMRKYYSHQALFPELIIADAKIGSHMSASDTAKTGTSIIAAAVDSILSKYSNEVTNSSALRAIELVQKNIIPSIRDPKNLGAKNALYAASLLTGISQSISSLGICFALSLACSSMTKLDIFQAMSIFLPHVMEYNLTSSANRYVMIARALDEDINDISIIEAAIRAVEGIRKIYLELKIPQKLSEYEVKKIELPSIAALSVSFQFLESLQRELPKNEIETILVAAY